MPGVDALRVLASISGVFGLVAVLAYFFFLLQARQAERSVAALLGDDSVVSSDRLMRLLTTFKDDATRLEALKQLLNHDGRRAKALLDKVKSNIDLNTLDKRAQKMRLDMSRLAAGIFLVLSLAAFGYATIRPEGSSAAKSETQTEPGTPSTRPSNGDVTPNDNATPEATEDSTPVVELRARPGADELGGHWVRQTNLLDRMPGVSIIGDCGRRTVTSRSLELMSRGDGTMIGSYASDQTVTIEATPSDASMTSHEFQRGECNRWFLQDETTDRRQTHKRGSVTVVWSQKEVVAYVEYAECTIDGVDCPGSEFGRRRLGRLSVISPDKIVVSDMTFDRAVV